MQPELPPQAAVLDVIAGYWLSRAVYLAARLKLADAVGDGATLGVSPGRPAPEARSCAD
jgi:hypothetical protein